MMSETDYRKGFALACRFLADNVGCPASVSPGVHFPECNGEEEQCGNEALWECWQRYFQERMESEQVCRVCGCTDDNACPGGCWWVEEVLCSACVDTQMKYFEFPVENGSYYALIGAETEEEAVSCYNEAVGEMDWDYPGPDEISEETARQKFAKGKAENGIEEIRFDETLKHSPCILLIDSNLA